MMNLNEILKSALDKNCSDIYLSVGASIFGRINSKLEVIHEKILNQNDTEFYAKEILDKDFNLLNNNGEVDKSFSISGLGRFRANIFKQRNSLAISIKVISLSSSNFEDLDLLIPYKIFDFICNLQQGLVLITGTVGSGRSTTIASIINQISRKFSKHIVTVEESIEILYKHNNSIVNQREIGSDTESYLTGIEAAFKEKPDILVIDNIPNYEVMKMILKCCDAGMLVISSIYANNVKNTIDTLLEMDLNNIYLRNNLSNIIRCIVNQKIILDKEMKKICLHEIMINTLSISNCIRENKIKHILPLMQNGVKLGMCTLDMSLIEAYKNYKISRNVLLENITNKELAAKIILNY